MKFIFADKNDPVAVNNTMIGHLGGRELGKMLDLEVQDGGEELIATVSKLGKSTLFFNITKINDGNGLRYDLDREKVAFAHRPFKNEIKKKLARIIEQMGGEIIET